VYVNLRFLIKGRFKKYNVVKSKLTTKITSEAFSSANTADEIIAGAYSPFGRTH
jgi:hypothetical protein